MTILKNFLSEPDPIIIRNVILLDNTKNETTEKIEEKTFVHEEYVLIDV